MRVDNQPFGNLNELLYPNAFTTHPYKNPVIGSMADLDAATIQDVRQFFDTYYVPANATVVIAGDFDVAETKDLVTRYFGRIPPAAKPVPRDIAQEPTAVKEKRVTLEEAWPLPAVIVAQHITYDGHPDSYPMHVLAKVLSDGNSSRIYKSLVYEKGLAVAAFGGANLIENPNLFFAVAIVNPGQSLEAVEKALVAELDKAVGRGHHRPRAAAGQEPVRPRLHPGPRDGAAEGRRAGPRRGAARRHHHRRRRVRDLPEHDARPTSSASPRRISRPQSRVVLHVRPKARGDPSMSRRAFHVVQSSLRRRHRRAGGVGRGHRRRPAARRRPALAVRAAAAAARRQAGEVPALRDPDPAQRAAGRARQPGRAAGGQRPDADSRRRRPGPQGQGGPGDADRGAARSGHDDALGGADRRGDRLHGRPARQRRRHRPQLRQHRQHERRPGPGARPDERRRAPPGVLRPPRSTASAARRCRR